jgi:hypothetical protein
MAELANGAGYFNPGWARHGDIQQDNVGPIFSNCRYGFVTIGAFGLDLIPREGFKKGADSCPYQ